MSGTGVSSWRSLLRCLLLQCIWGSYWKEGKWGYKCCHSFVKYSYCTGEAGKEIAVSIVLFSHLERAKKRSSSHLSFRLFRLFFWCGFFVCGFCGWVFFVLSLSDVLSNQVSFLLSVAQNTEASLLEDQPREEEHATKPKTLMEVGRFPFSGRQIFFLSILRYGKICITTK